MNSHLDRNWDNYEAEAGSARAERAFSSDQVTKVRTIAKVLGSLSRREHIAEVGSFTGYAAEQYARTPGVASVTCFDLSETALLRCRERGLKSSSWNADGQPCPSPDASFDVVLAPDIIEHLVDTEFFLSELHRICKPDGYLVLSTPNLAFWLNRVRLLLGRVPWSYPGVSSQTKRDPAIDLNHLRINVPAEWGNLLEACGWRVERIAVYSLLDDQPMSLKMGVLKLIDRVARIRQELAFGHIYIAKRCGKAAAPTLASAGSAVS